MKSWVYTSAVVATASLLTKKKNIAVTFCRLFAVVVVIVTTVTDRRNL